MLFMRRGCGIHVAEPLVQAACAGASARPVRPVVCPKRDPQVIDVTAATRHPQPTGTAIDTAYIAV